MDPNPVDPVKNEDKKSAIKERMAKMRAENLAIMREYTKQKINNSRIDRKILVKYAQFVADEIYGPYGLKTVTAFKRKYGLRLAKLSVRGFIERISKQLYTPLLDGADEFELNVEQLKRIRLKLKEKEKKRKKKK